jgi:hypothetical protein
MPPLRAMSRSPSTTMRHLALVQDVRQLNIAGGISRVEFPDVSAQHPPRNPELRRGRYHDHRAEFRLRSAHPHQADGEGGRPDRHAAAHQPRHRHRNPRARQGALHRRRHGAPDRRADRGAARRWPAGARDLRPRAAQPARAPDAVGQSRFARAGTRPVNCAISPADSGGARIMSRSTTRRAAPSTCRAG